MGNATEAREGKDRGTGNGAVITVKNPPVVDTMTEGNLLMEKREFIYVCDVQFSKS